MRFIFAWIPILTTLNLFILIFDVWYHSTDISKSEFVQLASSVGVSNTSCSSSVRGSDGSPGFPYDLNDPCNLQFLLSSSFTSEHLLLFQQHCDLIWYNRCMKAGSTTLTKALESEHASIQTCADLLSSFHNYLPSDRWEEKAQEMANTAYRPCIRMGHHFFIPFRRVSVAQPLIINLVRHPIPRLISQYFFEAFTMGRAAENNLQTNTSHVQGSLRDCALGQKPMLTCNRFFGYFCEDESVCRPRGADALALAKQNIEEYGMIIGLTEELASFLEVLERLLPRFFGNLRQLYNETYEKSEQLSSNKVVQATYDLKTHDVKQLPYILDTEIELYNFIKKRFYKIKQKIFELTR